MALDSINDRIVNYFNAEYEKIDTSLKLFCEFKNIDIEKDYPEFTREIYNEHFCQSKEVITYKGTPIIACERNFNHDLLQVKTTITEIWKNGLQ